MLWLCCLGVVASCPEPEYDGPAYAERSGQPPALLAGLEGEALLWSVRAGMGPQLVSRLFGPPLLESQFRDGPVEWWYPQFGVTAFFPRRLWSPDPQAERVRGGIGW